MAVAKHKTRLEAEFTRLRVRKGFGTLEAFKAFVNTRDGAPTDDGESKEGHVDGSNAGALQKQSHVRWVRINTLRTTMEEQLQTIFSEFKMVPNLSEITKVSTSAANTERLVYGDRHIPNLLAVPRKLDLTGTVAYQEGHIIFQDKASCFPAYLLDISSTDGDIIDACAAPGNKTSHLASFLPPRAKSAAGQRRIWAIERDKERALTLEKMIQWTGAKHLVMIDAAKDFTQLNPLDRRYSRVEAILLDPSCSGSGILGRDDGVDFMLPEKDRLLSFRPLVSGKKPKKPRSKRKSIEATITPPNLSEGLSSKVDDQKNRLISLATFQLKLLTHAFRFPRVRRIVYSTCSIHEIENEQVVIKALNSQEAKEGGWKILRRKDQVAGLRDWGIRGNTMAFHKAVEDHDLADELADACIRCGKGGEHGTIGFFVVGFVRVGTEQSERSSAGEKDSEDSEEEWNGFSDEDEKSV